MDLIEHLLLLPLTDDYQIKMVLIILLEKKLFSIPYLNEAISYFALAMFYRNNTPFSVSDFLKPFIQKNYQQTDLQSFVAFWESLNGIYSKLLQFPDFKQPGTPDESGEYARFKFEFIVYIYKKWADMQIIALSIDVIVLTNNLN
jgi:hypothetical protein